MAIAQTKPQSRSITINPLKRPANVSLKQALDWLEEAAAVGNQTEADRLKTEIDASLPPTEVHRLQQELYARSLAQYEHDFHVSAQ